MFESECIPITFRINAKPLGGMPDPARWYQYDSASLIHHDEIFVALSPWHGASKQKIGSNLVARSFCCRPTRLLARSEHYGLGPFCLDPNFILSDSIRDFDSQHVIENNGAEPEPEQEKKGRFQINGPLLRCLLLEGHHPLIWRSLWCSPWVCLCPRVYIMICSTELSGIMSASCPPICFRVQVGKMTHVSPSSEGEWYMYEE